MSHWEWGPLQVGKARFGVAVLVLIGGNAVNELKEGDQILSSDDMMFLFSRNHSLPNSFEDYDGDAQCFLVYDLFSCFEWG